MRKKLFSILALLCLTAYAYGNYILIKNGESQTLSSDFTCEDFSMNSNSTLTVNQGVTLTLNITGMPNSFSMTSNSKIELHGIMTGSCYKYYISSSAVINAYLSDGAKYTANGGKDEVVYHGYDAATDGNGTVSVKNGTTDVTSESTGSYTTTYTFTATPASGYKFKNWTKGAGGEVLGTDASINVTCEQNGTYQVYANFEEDAPAGTALTPDATRKVWTLDAMPAGNVELQVEYYSLAGVKLTSQGTGGTAALLNTAFGPLTETEKIEEGEKFALMLTRAEGYDFSLTMSQEAEMAEFSAEDYENYVAYAKANGQSVDLNTVLTWVTMPDTKDQDLTMTVQFREPKTFTLLYQPTESATEVWCRLGIPSSSGLGYDVAKMKCDSELDDGTKVWSVKATAAFDPTKVGFFTSKEAAENDGAQTSAASVSNNTTSWNSVSGGKYILIGGNAKSVVAAFVGDASAMPVYDSETMGFDGSTNTTGVRYQIAVCLTDGDGNVTTAAQVKTMSAPTAPEGKTFDKWSVLAGEAPNKVELRLAAGETYTIKENTIFAAVWKPTVLRATMNLGGGTGVAGSQDVTYNELLSLGTPTRTGFVFDGWTVNNSVTEGGQLFGKGSLFDLETPITANLGLTAQWHHVHSYTCYRIDQFGDALAAYMKYNDIAHIAVCGCNDIKLTMHNFGASGKCACGMKDPTRDLPADMDISYGQWSGGNYTEKMKGFPVTAKVGEEVTVDAPHNWGNLEFQKWQYSTNNGKTWYDLAAFEIVSFIIPCDMMTRALYVNPVTAPQIDLSARQYDDHAEVNGQTYTMDNVLFQMNYKLPDGYTFLDGGIRMGDNAGISYYELKERTISMDAESKAIGVGVCVVTSVLSGGINTFDASASEKIYVEHQNSVLDEISASELAKYMYESRPVNMEKYDPIYWEAKSQTKGMSGSMATMPPLRFIQKDNGQHYIYGIGWMRYKDASGKTCAIYTDALATTRDNIPGYTVTKTGAQAAGARQMAPARAMAQTAPRRTPAAQAEHDPMDMSLVMAPETQLNVYVDGEWASDLSRSYGYGDKATLQAPALSGKQFAYWEADGQPVSSSSELTLTMNAHTTLRAVYDAQPASAATVGFTSVTGMGNQISLQAHCDGNATAAGIIYSTSVSGDNLTIGANGVTQVAAVSAQSLGSATTMPASILDANNSWMLRIATTDDNTVYHARAYATVGGNTTYGAVRDVKLADLESGIMSIVNLDGFEPGLDAALKEVQESGQAVVYTSISFNAKHDYTIESGKATVTIDGTDKTADIDNGTLSGLTKGQTVTVTISSEDYMFKSLTATVAADPTNLATLNTDNTVATFTVPESNATLEYDIVRNLASNTTLNLFIGTDAVTADARLRIKKDGSAYIPVSALSFTLTDAPEGGQTTTLTAAQALAAKLNPVYELKGEGEDQWTIVAINAETHLPATLAPGQTYRVSLVAADDAPLYGGEVQAQYLVTLFEGYEVTVPAGEYITYYRDEPLMVDKTQQPYAELYTISEVGTETATLSGPYDAMKTLTPMLVFNSSDDAQTILLIPTTEPDLAVTVAPEFKGTLEATQIAASSATSNNYAFNGKQFVWVKNAIAVAANKAWLEVPVSTSNNVKAIKLVLDDTTEVKEVTGVKEVNDDSFYDLNGRKLQSIPTRKGIYIWNGKKVVK